MSLTIEEIKTALSDKGIALPSGRARKEEYIKLYQEHIVLNNSVGDNYSSDEEGSQNSKKVTSTSATLNSQSMDESVQNMTNDELFNKLTEFGVNTGPVVSSTRSLYEKKYLQYLRGETTNKTSNGESEKFKPHLEDVSDSEEVIVRGRPRASPAPGTPRQGSVKDERSFSSQPRVISYMEIIPKGSSQRIIEPVDAHSSLSSVRQRATANDVYVGKWSPKMKPFSTSTIQSEKKTASTRNIILFIGIGLLLIVLLGIGYHQWSINDPYQAIEDEADIVVQEFASQKKTP